MIVRNLSGRVLRFVDLNDQLIATLPPEATVASLETPDTLGSLGGVRTREIHCASPVGVPAAVPNTYLLVARGILLQAYERGLSRVDIWEPEDEVVLNGETCYRGVRHYVD